MSVPVLTATAEIEALAARLAREPVVAVDLEADSLHSYHEKVCLLQFSTPEETVLVDPLAGASLAALAPLMADPAIRKLFHAADYDLRCLRRDFGWQVRGLFDTLFACQFLGEEKIGLADVLGKHFGVQLDKRFQQADWSQRPLSPEMMRYAAEDTRHLHRLAALLEERLAAAGRLAWVLEECALQEEVAFQEHAGPRFLRFKGAAALAPRQLATLEALLEWRDEEAARRDVPPFKVLGNAPLLEVARHAPRTPQGLVGLMGFPPRLAERYGRALLAVVESALAVPEAELPRFPRGERQRPDPRVEARLQRLKAWRAGCAAALGIAPGTLINNSQLEALALSSATRSAELPGLKRWQREVLGTEILRQLTTD